MGNIRDSLTSAMPPTPAASFVKHLIFVGTIVAFSTFSPALTADGHPPTDGLKASADEPSAWDVLTRDRPEAASDPSLSPMERRILQVLTSEQAEAFSGGADPARLVLPNGETLADYIERAERLDTVGLVFKPVEPCVLIDTRAAGAKFEPGEIRRFLLRGEDTDYSSYGGSETGCRIPGLTGTTLKANSADALFLNVEVFDAEGDGEVKIWPGGHSEPLIGQVAYADISSLEGFRNAVIVRLCDEESASPCESGDLQIQTRGGAANLRVSTLGLFTKAGPPDSQGAAGKWIKDGNDIYYVEGNVGIGVTTPTERLTISGNVRVSSGTVCDDNGCIGDSQWQNGPGGRIYYDGGMVGVGTSTPEADLHVQGADNDGADAALKVTSGSQTMLIDGNEIDAAAGLFLNHNVGDDVTVGSGGGRVAIGAPGPSHLLNVIGGGDATVGGNVDISELSTVFRRQNNSDGSAVGVGFASSTNSANVGSAIVHERVGEGDGFDSRGGLHFATKGSTAPGANIPVRMTIDLDGRVGIGTRNPDQDLVVQGNDPVLQIRDDTSDNSAEAARLELLERAGGTFNGGAYLSWNGEDDRLLIGTKEGGVARDALVVERASGNVGIGTSDPKRKLHVVDETVAQVRMVATASDVTLITSARGSSDGVHRGEIGTLSVHDLVLVTDSLPRMRIESNGDICIGSGC